MDLKNAQRQQRSNYYCYWVTRRKWALHHREIIEKRHALRNYNENINSLRNLAAIAKHDDFLPMRQNLFYFRGAGNICLANGLRQLTRNVKHDVRTLNFRSDVDFAPARKTPNDVLRKSLNAVLNVKKRHN